MTVARYARGVPPTNSPLQELMKLGLFAIKFPSLAYNATSPATVFRHPANTLIMGILVVVNTAFDAAAKIQFGDGTTAALYGTLTGSLRATGPKMLWIGKNQTAAGTIAATIAPGSATAGSVDLYLVYSPNTDAQHFISDAR